MDAAHMQSELDRANDKLDRLEALRKGAVESYQGEMDELAGEKSYWMEERKKLAIDLSTNTLFITALISQDQFLSEILPSIHYIEQLRNTTHKSFNEPKKISSWIDYFTKVNNFDFEKEAKYNKPVFVNADNVVRHGRSGLPDFVAKKENTNILVIEVKKKNVLPIDRGSSVEFFQNHSKGQCVISQAFTYMISETLSFDNNNPTVLKAYAYLALRAKHNHYLPHPNLISIPNTMSQPRYLTRSVNRGQNQQPPG
ncbi:3038_t:CDS:2, partial [Funneliformis caledonium]